MIEKVFDDAGGVEIRPPGKTGRSGIKSGTSVGKKGEKKHGKRVNYQL